MKSNNKLFSIVSAVILLVLGFIWFFNHRRSDLTDELELTLTGEKTSFLANTDYYKEIQSIYADRDYLEIWLKNGLLSKIGEEMLVYIEDSKFDGLQPKDYNLIQIYNMSTDSEKKNKKFRNLTSDEKVNLELLLTDGFFNLVHDLEKGKVNPSSLDPNWKFEEKPSVGNYSEMLAEIANGESVETTLSKLNPSSKLYGQGKKAIENLYEIQKNDTLTWTYEAVEGSIDVGQLHAAIPAIRKRLVFWNFMKPYELVDPTLFDSTMLVGLKKYQESNGMNPDGVIGSLVAESLNKSPQDLIDIASINMERLRWMPELDWEQEMVLVNIANYQLDYMKKSDTTFSAKVIVGKEYNESPTFTAPMSYIAFSPYWNIPSSIMHDEIIPAVQKDKSYLSRKNMEVISSDGEPLNVKNVDWNLKSGENFPYLIRQKPGGDNSLGLVKFMFPNEYNIYIHDTPARGLFDRESRALSHGCIRIQNPDKFAKILLNDQSWTDEKIQQAMHQQTEEVVKLDREIPVVIVYMTFWADQDGKANFRSDVYNRDEALLNALRSKNSRLAQN
jgi:murein L,D-transpeptidase YcbB/YkuD